jgi:hypothetical protein
MNWQIRTGRKSVLGVEQAFDIVVGRLEYLAEHGSRGTGTRLLEEAIQYSRLIRDWVRENAPRVELKEVGDTMDYVGVRPGGKPGPMSDG